ncbi:MAG: response regulator transcription factor [Kofleriaceae bacterium]|nr:response regulator transcription factor [Kofleriaceae bacterium]
MRCCAAPSPACSITPARSGRRRRRRGHPLGSRPRRRARARAHARAARAGRARGRGHPRAEHLGPALAAGARGVVLRDDVGPELVAALAAVKHGLTVIDTALSPGLLAAPRADARPVEHRPRSGGGELTERERQVVALLAEGLSNKLIADRLGISDHTAKFHVNGVMAKLGAGTRTEAVVEAVRRGLVTL